MGYYNRAFSVAVEILPHYINFSGSYTAQVFNDEEHARRTGYRPTIYRDQYGWTIWEYVPEWLGIERKYYNLKYALVLPI